MSGLFITASGTGVGKTLVTAALARQFAARGEAVDVLKPVISGFDPRSVETSDTGILLHALDRELTPSAIDQLSPWRFAAPLSPDMAAARQGCRIDFDALVALCRDRARRERRLLIEGVGGVMVPLTEDRTVLDWIAALDYPAVLVVGSYLGTISHTLTALGALERRGVRLIGIVISESPESPVPLDETASAIARFTPAAPIALTPRLSEPDPWRRVPDLLGPLGL